MAVVGRCPNGGKIAYDTRDAAEREHRRIMKAVKWKVPQRAYQCPSCRFWHLTTVREGADGRAA